MPVGDANTLVFTSPVFTALFAICLVGEKWHWLDIICTLLTFAGVLCVTKPSFIFGDIVCALYAYSFPRVSMRTTPFLASLL